MRLTSKHIALLKSLSEGKILCAKFGGGTPNLQGYIDGKRVCRERTWIALFKEDYIADIGNFKFGITDKGKIVLNETK